MIVLGVIWNLGKSRQAKHSKGLLQEGELTKVDTCGYWGAGASKNFTAFSQFEHKKVNAWLLLSNQELGPKG